MLSSSATAVLEAVVDDGVVEFRAVGHVGGGVGQPAGDDRVAVGPAVRSRSSSAAREGGRMKIDAQSGHALAHLAGALPVDLQQHAAPGGELRRDLLAAGAVLVVEHAGVLEEGAGGDQPLEFRPG